MGRTYQALLRGQQEREAADDFDRLRESDSETTSRILIEDLAALRVSVDALEDRIELELPAFQAELRETIGKATQSSVRPGPYQDLAEERARTDLAALRATVERIERSLRWLLVLGAVVSTLALLRC